MKVKLELGQKNIQKAIRREFTKDTIPLVREEEEEKEKKKRMVMIRDDLQLP